MVAPLRNPARQKAARKKKPGGSGRDDRNSAQRLLRVLRLRSRRRDDRTGSGRRAVQLKSVGGDFGVFGGPVVGREGDAPEFGGRFQEFYADFGFAFGGGGDVNDTDELLFEGVGIAAKNFLAHFDASGYVDEGAVGADVRGESVFGDVLTIGSPGNDEDGETEVDALGAAAVGNGGVVGGEVGHGGDGLGIVLEKKRGRSRGGRY
jgi:hypothetical protein